MRELRLHRAGGTAAHLVTPSEDLPDTDVLTCRSLPTSDLVLDL